MRAEAVQAIDEMIGISARRSPLAGSSPNTYILFTSDNGLHMGEHRLAAGKQTAFETDIHVPLVVTGPGVPHGGVSRRSPRRSTSTPPSRKSRDARSPKSVDGRSLKPLLEGHDGRPAGGKRSWSSTTGPT